jgi:LEA14-like dessication related protein
MKIRHMIYLGIGGSILIIIVVLVYLEGNAGVSNGNIKKVQDDTANNVAQHSDSQRSIRISVANVTVNKINNNNSYIQVIFDVNNPTRGTIILEEIQYDMMIGNARLASGSIGEKLEGFLTPSADIYPIIGNSSVILKDRQVVNRHNLGALIWNKIYQGNAEYTIDGTISYKSTTGLESNRLEKDFKLTFPPRHNIV